MPYKDTSVYMLNPSIGWAESLGERRAEKTPVERLRDRYETLGYIEGSPVLEIANLTTELLYARHDFFSKGAWYVLLQIEGFLYVVPRREYPPEKLPQASVIGEVHSGMITPQVVEVINAWHTSL